MYHPASTDTGAVRSLVTRPVFKTGGGRIPSLVSSILICSRQPSQKIFGLLTASGSTPPAAETTPSNLDRVTLRIFPCTLTSRLRTLS